MNLANCDSNFYLSLRTDRFILICSISLLLENPLKTRVIRISREDACRDICYRSFRLAFNSCKIVGLNALVIHRISAANMHASNGCPGSNPARPAHPPPPYRGRSFGYLWPRARCRAGRRGGLACGEGRRWRFQGGGGRLTLLLVRTSRGAGEGGRNGEDRRKRGGERERMRASERETEMGKESDRLTGGGNRPSLYGACSEVYKGLLY